MVVRCPECSAHLLLTISERVEIGCTVCPACGGRVDILSNRVSDQGGCAKCNRAVTLSVDSSEATELYQVVCTRCQRAGEKSSQVSLAWSTFLEAPLR